MKNRVLLVGLYGVYNYGCEAIVRGSVEILKHKYNGNVEITLATPSLLDDSKRLNDCDISLIERRFDKYKIKNIVRKLANKIGTNFPVIVDKVENIETYNAVYSVGGDIYTLDHEGFAPLNFMAFANDIIDRGIPYYMLCSSIGPFKQNSELKYIVPHLRKISRIYAREESTIQYLKSIGIVDNVQFLPDPAFQVDPKNKKKGKRRSNLKNIGINLSPLSAVHYYKSIDEGIDAQARSIEKLILEMPEVFIHLIPHVKSQDRLDDDFRYLMEVKNRVTDNNNRVIVYDADDGFVGRKEIIKKMDLVIAARMHCAINAICCNIPTIFLSYSQKAIGMSTLVYGSSDYVVDITKFENIVDLATKYYDIPDFEDAVKKLQDLDAWLQ